MALKIMEFTVLLLVHFYLCFFLFHLVDAWSHIGSTMYSNEASCIEYCRQFSSWTTYFNHTTPTEVNVPGIHFNEQSWCKCPNEIDSRRNSRYYSTFDKRLVEQFWTYFACDWTLFTMCRMFNGKNCIFTFFRHNLFIKKCIFRKLSANIENGDTNFCLKCSNHPNVWKNYLEYRRCLTLSMMRFVKISDQFKSQF